MNHEVNHQGVAEDRPHTSPMRKGTRHISLAGASGWYERNANLAYTAVAITRGISVVVPVHDALFVENVRTIVPGEFGSSG